jgi:hypothetical protein
MNTKALALLAAGLIAASTTALAAPDQKCGAGSCSKKEAKSDAQGKDASCSKKEASCSKKDAGCSKKDASCSKKDDAKK